MKVSFIIPAYNLPIDLLRECILSILALSLSAEERQIIVVDDGSEYSPILELLDLANDILYIRQANGGLSKARNMGLKVATGDYIQFVDGDDRLLQNPYEHCLDIIRFQDPDVVLFSSTSIGMGKNSFSAEGPFSGVEWMHNHNLQGSACTCVFKKSVLGGLRFSENLLHEDEEFVPLLMLKAERVFQSNSVAYFYRKRTDSIINKVDSSHRQQLLDDMEKVIYRLQDVSGRLNHSEKQALERRIAQLTMDYLYNVMRDTHDKEMVHAAMVRLEKRGLYPLPQKAYTKKYMLFRALMQSALGRNILIRLVR